MPNETIKNNSQYWAIVESSSPLYEYCQSRQNDSDEKFRLKKATALHPVEYNLFVAEPYKWEILYQSIIREISKGDKTSIKGLNILLSMIKEEEKAKALEAIARLDLFEESSLNLIREGKVDSRKSKRNFWRFTKILLDIFTNPYSIDIKGRKNHLYEYTGYSINQIRKWIRRLAS